VAGAGKGQVLDVRAQRVACQCRLDQVGARSSCFGDDVADIVDHIGVVAEAARYCVRTEPTVENVGSGVAGQDVVESVARGVQVGGTGQCQILDIIDKIETDRTVDAVVALTRGLNDNIPGFGNR